MSQSESGAHAVARRDANLTEVNSPRRSRFALPNVQPSYPLPVSCGLAEFFSKPTLPSTNATQARASVPQRNDLRALITSVAPIPVYEVLQDTVPLAASIT